MLAALRPRPGPSGSAEIPMHILSDVLKAHVSLLQRVRASLVSSPICVAR
jgi:hypothetical protein